MLARHAIAFVLACSIAATTAVAANGQRTDVPACEELLTIAQAKKAMREPLAAILTREVVGTTRNCDYVGGKRNTQVQRTLGVTWGPWADLRKRAPTFAKTAICPASKSACQDMKKVATTRRDLDSFRYLEQALSKVGTVRRLREPVFEGNPVLVWRPSEATGAASHMGWVLGYDADTGSLIETFCIDNTVDTPDVACAIDAAEQVYENVKS
jgi:hypothetical protein